MTTIVHSIASNKEIDQFIEDFVARIRLKGFSVHNESQMAMKDIFHAHEQDVPEDFDLHMIQICKPEKAAKSLMANLERAVLMPKFVMVFSQDGKTQVRMLRYGQELVETLIDDTQYAASMQETFNLLGAIIDEVA